MRARGKQKGGVDIAADSSLYLLPGARDRGRTGTALRPRDFKSLASTNSATRACVRKLHPWLVYRLLTLSRRSLPVLKKGVFLAGIFTTSPLLGFLASRASRSRMVKLP